MNARTEHNQEALAGNKFGYVAQQDACPMCFEARADMLIWDDAGETVRCVNCLHVYVPSTGYDRTSDLEPAMSPEDAVSYDRMDYLHVEKRMDNK